MLIYAFWAGCFFAISIIAGNLMIRNLEMKEPIISLLIFCIISAGIAFVYLFNALKKLLNKRDK